MFVILRRLKRHGLLVAVGLLYLYLALHMLSGSQGMLRLAQYGSEIGHLQAQIVDTKARRIALEQHAVQLRSEHLSLDALDEEARRHLGVSHVKDIVIILDGE